MTTAVLIISLALGLVSPIVNETMTHLNGKLRGQIEATASKLKSQIARDSTLKEEIYNAYSTRNNNLMNELLSSTGFGARYMSIKKALEANEGERDAKIKEANIKINQSQDALDKLNTATTNTYSNTIAGYNQAKDAIERANNLANGGLNERK